MSETKFTPGPWSIGFDDGSGIAGGRQETTIISAECEGEIIPHVICECRRSGANFESLPVEANTHLIASAPEMYEMLCGLRGLIDFHHVNIFGSGTTPEGQEYPIRDEVLDNISKVLRSARGESND